MRLNDRPIFLSKLKYIKKKTEYTNQKTNCFQLNICLTSEKVRPL